MKNLIVSLDVLSPTEALWDLVTRNGLIIAGVLVAAVIVITLAVIFVIKKK